MQLITKKQRLTSGTPRIIVNLTNKNERKLHIHVENS